MGGLAGMFGGAAGAAGAAEGAAASGAMEGAAAAGGATAANAAMSSGLGGAAAEGLAQGAAQSAAMNTLQSAGTLNPQGISALGEGLQNGVLQSMYGNQWGAGIGGQAMPQMASAMPQGMPDVGGVSMPQSLDFSNFDMAQHSTGMTPPQAKPNAFGQLVKDWFMNSSPIGRFVKGRLDARAAMRGGLFGQGSSGTQIPQWTPGGDQGFQLPQMQGGSPQISSRTNKLVQDLLSMVAMRNGGMM